MTETRWDETRPLFVFDGVCALCSGGVRHLMRFDRRKKLQFTSAQSPLGQSLYERFGLEMDETYLLVIDGRPHVKSAGYLELCRVMGGAWHIMRLAKIVPRSMRDRIYDVIARNRYRWFGKTGHCALLTDYQRSRLI